MPTWFRWAPVRFGNLRIQDKHLIKLLRTLGTVLQHGPHGGIAVDIGVFPLDIAFLGILESQVFQRPHQGGVHFTDLGPGGPVENEFFGRPRVAGFDQDLFNRVLEQRVG